MREVAGRYELLEALPGKSDGSVHPGHDRQLGRQVLVWLLPRRDGAADAALPHRLLHSNIVRILDRGEDAEQAWIVTEQPEGESLATLLERGRRFTVPEALRITQQVLAALDHAHRSGVVHGNVRPANITLAQSGEVKLGGFGLAPRHDRAPAFVKTAQGLAAYMAPEQLAGSGAQRVDLRADIWAVGAVLHEMLTGRKAFLAADAAALSRRLEQETPTPPSRLAELPAEADAVLARSLARQPTDRYASAADFAYALQALANHPVPPGAAQRTNRPEPLRLTRSGVAEFQRLPTPYERGRRRSRLLPFLLGGVVVLGGIAAVAFLLTEELLVVQPPGTPAESMAVAAAATPPAPAPNPTPPAEPPASPRTPPAVASPPRDDGVRKGVTEPPQSQPAQVQSPTEHPAQGQPKAQAPSPAAPPSGRAVVEAPSAPPPPDLGLVAQQVIRTPACGLLTAQASQARLSLVGVMRRNDSARVRQVLDEARLPDAAAELNLALFDADYCPMMRALRAAMLGNARPPRLRLPSPDPLLAGQRLRFKVEMPDWPAFLHVFYLDTAGHVGNLVQAGNAPYPPGAVPEFGRPYWVASEPFGTDLLIAVASERPLFRGARRNAERQDDVAAALRTALERAQAAGQRIAVSAVTQQTSRH